MDCLCLCAATCWSLPSPAFYKDGHGHSQLFRRLDVATSRRPDMAMPSPLERSREGGAAAPQAPASHAAGAMRARGAGRGAGGSPPSSLWELAIRLGGGRPDSGQAPPRRRFQAQRLLEMAAQRCRQPVARDPGCSLPSTAFELADVAGWAVFAGAGPTCSLTCSLKCRSCPLTCAFF